MFLFVLITRLSDIVLILQGEYLSWSLMGSRSLVVQFHCFWVSWKCVR